MGIVAEFGPGGEVGCSVRASKLLAPYGVQYMSGATACYRRCGGDPF